MSISKYIPDIDYAGLMYRETGIKYYDVPYYHSTILEGIFSWFALIVTEGETYIQHAIGSEYGVMPDAFAPTFFDIDKTLEELTSNSWYNKVYNPAVVDSVGQLVIVLLNMRGLFGNTNINSDNNLSAPCFGEPPDGGDTLDISAAEKSVIAFNGKSGNYILFDVTQNKVIDIKTWVEYKLFSKTKPASSNPYSEYYLLFGIPQIDWLYGDKYVVVHFYTDSVGANLYHDIQTPQGDNKIDYILMSYVNAQVQKLPLGDKSSNKSMLEQVSTHMNELCDSQQEGTTTVPVTDTTIKSIAQKELDRLMRHFEEPVVTFGGRAGSYILVNRIEKEVLSIKTWNEFKSALFIDDKSTEPQVKYTELFGISEIDWKYGHELVVIHLFDDGDYIDHETETSVVFGGQNYELLRSIKDELKPIDNNKTIRTEYY